MSDRLAIITANFRTLIGPAFMPTELIGLKKKGPAVFEDTSGPLKAFRSRQGEMYSASRRIASGMENAVSSTGWPRPIRGPSRAFFADVIAVDGQDFRAPEASLVRDGYPSPFQSQLAYPARA